MSFSDEAVFEAGFHSRIKNPTLPRTSAHATKISAAAGYSDCAEVSRDCSPGRSGGSCCSGLREGEQHAGLTIPACPSTRLRTRKPAEILSSPCGDTRCRCSCWSLVPMLIRNGTIRNMPNSYLHVSNCQSDCLGFSVWLEGTSCES